MPNNIDIKSIYERLSQPKIRTVDEARSYIQQKMDDVLSRSATKYIILGKGYVEGSSCWGFLYIDKYLADTLPEDVAYTVSSVAVVSNQGFWHLETEIAPQPIVQSIWDSAHAAN